MNWPTPYQRIMHAAKKGVGVRLSADEVFALSMDDAISAAAENDDADKKGALAEKIHEAINGRAK